MIKKYYLYDDSYGCICMLEVTKHNKIDNDDQYVKLEDFEKLQKIFIDMTLCYQCEDILSAPSYEDVQNKYKKLIGEIK
tara:strand:- start:901 stop:1137 length:237 start_codon:yes stop_codon:yes gene_type:complete